MNIKEITDCIRKHSAPDDPLLFYDSDYSIDITFPDETYRVDYQIEPKYVHVAIIIDSDGAPLTAQVMFDVEHSIKARGAEKIPVLLTIYASDRPPHPARDRGHCLLSPGKWGHMTYCKPGVYKCSNGGRAPDYYPIMAIYGSTSNAAKHRPAAPSRTSSTSNNAQSPKQQSAKGKVDFKPMYKALALTALGILVGIGVIFGHNYFAETNYREHYATGQTYSMAGQVLSISQRPGRSDEHKETVYEIVIMTEEPLPDGSNQYWSDSTKEYKLVKDLDKDKKYVFTFSEDGHLKSVGESVR